MSALGGEGGGGMGREGCGGLSWGEVQICVGKGKIDCLSRDQRAGFTGAKCLIHGGRHYCIA